MKEWDIKTRVIVLALLPSIIIAAILGGYYTYNRFQDLDQQIRNAGLGIIHELASASGFAYQTRNFSYVDNLAQTTMQLPDVDAVVFYDSNNNIITYRAPESLKMAIVADAYKEKPASKINEIGEYMVFSQPITLHSAIEQLLDNNHDLTSPSNLVSILNGDRTLGRVAIYYNAQKMHLQQFMALLTSGLVLIIGLIISGFLAWRISKDITDPLTIISNTVNRLKKGELNARIPVHFSGQLAQLASGINEMASSLKCSQDELQSNIEQATKDLTESLETVEVQNIELNIARKEALEASRVKSEFIANISHEIRTPMNSIIGFTNLLLETDVNAHQRDYLFTIKKSAANLLDIINDILDFSKIEAGKLRLHYIPMDIRECVDDVLELLAPNAHSKQIELASCIDATVPQRLIGDPLRVKQVMINLVGNAIKFTEQGSVEIHVSLDTDVSNNYQIRIGVIDTGLGLTTEDQKQLFRAFSQADATSRRKYGGTGLGLVISKKLINQMGGTIGVHSEPYKGSNFWFTFLSEKSKVILNAIPDNKALANVAIALFEPYETLRNTLQNLFQEWQMQVSLCDNVAALSKLTENNQVPHQFIVIGMNQPYADIVNDILIIKAKSKAKLIVLFNSSDQQHYAELQKAGADLVLSKPINDKKMYHEICKLKNQQSIQTLSDDQHPWVNNHTINTPVNPVQSQSIHVLAVDDNPANLKLLAVLLEKLGISVSKANSGERALALAAQQRFDLILMDIQMPQIDGLEASSRIRQPQHLNQQTPIIAISAHVIGYEKEDLQAVGINDYLIKPINTDQLYQLLIKWTALVLEDSGTTSTIKEEIHMTEINKVIDMELGLKLAGNKSDLASELLQMLIDKLPSEKNGISKAFHDNDLPMLEHLVHRLHGATCYCGVPYLKAILSEYETTLKLGKKDQYQALMDKLMHEMDAVMDAYKLIKVKI